MPCLGGVGISGLHIWNTRIRRYRRWHRFSVERWQEGQWRKLSGPPYRSSPRLHRQYSCRRTSDIARE
jgi:hypothetical protein